jgi:thiaminase/transcriptional activator TenA
LRTLFDEALGDLGGMQRVRLQEIFDTSSRWEYLFWEMAWKIETWPV